MGRESTTGRRSGLAPLLERESEETTIERVALEAVAGSGSTLLIEGDPGIGKTVLVGQAVLDATRHGATSLTGSGGELEHEISFGVARQLFERQVVERSDAERRSLLTGPARPAASVLLGEEALEETDTAGFVHGLFWLSVALAEESPLVVAIDDAQWSDDASLRYAAYLARRIEELPILLVVATRVPTRGRALELLATRSQTTALRPKPLSAEAVAEVVRNRYDADATQKFCRACHEAGAGNPFMTAALLAALAEDRVQADQAGAARVMALTPDAIRRSVAARLGRLPDDTRALCAALAVLGRSGAVRHTAALAELDTARAAAAADTLTTAGLLVPRRPLEFVHPVVREVIYAAIEDGRRATLHRAAAEAYAEDGDLEAAATHLLNTDPASDGWVVDLLRDAARDALGRGSPETAADLLARALAEPPDAALRPRIIWELGAAGVQAGRPQAIEHLRDALEHDHSPDDEVQLTIELGLAQLHFGELSAAVETFRAALEDLPPEARGGRNDLRLEAQLATARDTVPAEDPAQSREWLESLAPQFEAESGLDELTLQACLAFARAKAPESRERVRPLAVRAVGPGGLLELGGLTSMGLFYATFALIACEEYDLAEARIDAALALARERSVMWAIGSQGHLRAHLALRRGDVGRAREEAERLVDFAEEHGFVAGLMATLGLLCTALCEAGAPDEAWEVLTSRGLDGGLPDINPVSLLCESRGVIKAHRGDYEGALDDLSEAGRRYERWGLLNPEIAEWRTIAAICAQRTGDADRAIALASDAERLAERWGGPRALGVAKRARSLVDSDPGATLEGLLEARRILEGSEARLEQARVDVDIGAALRRARQRREARPILTAAMAEAARLGAGTLAARARTELEAAGARPRSAFRTGVESLTPSERRVAEMAASGMKNREIAEALFVVPKTVEVHLSNTYRKLEIEGRERLAEALVAA